MFKPKRVLYEEEAYNYPLGYKLLTQYKKMGVPCAVIENHNSIKEMQSKENSEFPDIKKNLIIGIRKTHKYVLNNKISDFLVPYTSSGCEAMCLYCYLVCNFNKCSYLRLFVNREQMHEKPINTSNKSDRELTFEIGSNSDLILENTITGNLPWTIEKFACNEKGYITFPTKFDMVTPLLPLEHKGRVIVRMSVNPNEIIQKAEFLTSSLENRIDAVNKLAEADYKIGILIAPVIFIDNWKELYENLIKQLSESLSEKAKENLFFEVIFMTYSYIHRVINKDAFPNAMDLYDPQIMTVRGLGKYTYNQAVRNEGEEFFR